MQNSSREKAASLFKAAAKILCPAAAALLYAVFLLTFVYAAVIAAAWQSAPAFFLVGFVSMAALGLAVFATSASVRLISQRNASERAEGDTPSKKQKVLSFLAKNGGYIPLAVAIIFAVAVAASGGLDSSTWREESAAYYASFGYLAEPESRPVEYLAEDITGITVDAEGCSVVLRRSENAETVTVTTVVRYESRYEFSLGEDGVLTVGTVPFPELTRPRDKMLAFLFSPTAAEMQIVIDLPEDTPVTVIAGETVIAAE